MITELTTFYTELHKMVEQYTSAIKSKPEIARVQILDEIIAGPFYRLVFIQHDFPARDTKEERWKYIRKMSSKLVEVGLSQEDTNLVLERLSKD